MGYLELTGFEGFNLQLGRIVIIYVVFLTMIFANKKLERHYPRVFTNGWVRIVKWLIGLFTVFFIIGAGQRIVQVRLNTYWDFLYIVIFVAGFLLCEWIITRFIDKEKEKDGEVY